MGVAGGGGEKRGGLRRVNSSSRDHQVCHILKIKKAASKGGK